MIFCKVLRIIRYPLYPIIKSNLKFSVAQTGNEQPFGHCNWYLYELLNRERDLPWRKSYSLAYTIEVPAKSSSAPSNYKIEKKVPVVTNCSFSVFFFFFVFFDRLDRWLWMSGNNCILEGKAELTERDYLTIYLFIENGTKLCISPIQPSLYLSSAKQAHLSHGIVYMLKIVLLCYYY